MACIATSIYWETNYVLCIFAWFCCFGGTAVDAASIGVSATSAVGKRFKKK